VKIADLGLSRAFNTLSSEEYSLEIMTLFYRPPEVLLGGRMYSCAIDIWSVGVLFYELVEH
jgi:serine/threonine protein kinase